MEKGTVLKETYEIIENIGSGSGGIIYKAYHLRMKKHVAIKLIKNEIKSMLNNRSEVDMLKELKHSYIPQVIDFVEDGNDVYTVMEFIEGHNFSQLIRNGKYFTEKQVLKYGIQLCEAVDYLHRHTPPIIHSDIKPANVMLTPDDNICLIDFNISMMTNSGVAVSKGGSQGYAAPEQIMRMIDAPTLMDAFHEETRFIDIDETRTLFDNTSVERQTNAATKNISSAYIDIRTDIYGIGATLYHLLTLRTPVNGFFDFRGIKCSPEIENVIKTATNPDPEKRYKNVSEMKEALSFNTKKAPVWKYATAAICAVAVLALGIAIGSHGNNISDIVTETTTVQTSAVTTTEVTTTVPTIIETEPEVIVTTETSKEQPAVTTVPEVTASTTAATAETTVTTEATTAETTVATTKATTAAQTKAPVKTSKAVTTTAQKEEFITIKGKKYSTLMTELDLTGMELTDNDIKDISKMKNLEVLSLGNNKISSLTAIKDLKKLKKLNLYTNNISNINSLKNLTNLTSLSLSDNDISDISVLENLNKLKVLHMEGNNISNISALSNLTSLTDLQLGYNKISDISALKNATKLNCLYLNDNQISNIYALTNLTDIKILHLYRNKISDINSLYKLTNLTVLDIGTNQISNINSLSGLTNLTTLKLGYNQITDISSLRNLSQVTTLRLENNKISAISALGSLKKIQYLHLGENQIEDISEVKNLKELDALYLYKNQINNVNSLSELTNLTILDIGSNEITDIKCLAELENLATLKIGYNEISDIKALKSLTKLTYLKLSKNNISMDDVNWLKNQLPHCEIIN